MNQRDIDRIRIEQETRDYLASGGVITECPPCTFSPDMKKALETDDEIEDFKEVDND